SEPSIDGLSSYAGAGIMLNASHPVLTLDYGMEIGGWPFIDVATGPEVPVQVEFKYTEPFDGLNHPWGDGPWVYVNSLSNTFRTETFNISGAGHTESFLQQGGLRWQSITLLTDSSLVIQNIGIRSSVSVKNSSDLLGTFRTSNDMYQKVWGLGAGAVQASCVEAKSQPSTWEVTSEGSLIRGQYPAISSLGNNFANYTLEFSAKIVTGGLGWKIGASNTVGFGPYFVLTSTGPALESQNITSLPRNSLTMGFGYSVVDAQILSSATPVTYANLSISLSENTWYRISTRINQTGYTISIDEKELMFISSAPYQGYIDFGLGAPSVSQGTFGFGPFLNQAAWFKDVVVTAANGSVLYTNPLTSEDTLGEFSVATNAVATCLDGAKRDREIWIGDFSHTARIIAASTGRFDMIKSVIDFEFAEQLMDGPGYGLVPIQAEMGAGAHAIASTYPGNFAQTDYQFFFLVTLGDYYRLTGDLSLMQTHWASTKIFIDQLLERYLDKRSGLVAAENTFWFTALFFQNATAPTALFTIGLDQIARVAHALGDNDAATRYQGAAQDIAKAVNTQLWSEANGFYGVAAKNLTETSILATAFTIRAGIASKEQATSCIQQLEKLFWKIGYKDNTYTDNLDTTTISPNNQGFLLDSLFLAHLQLGVSADIVVPAIKTMAEVYWPLMVTQNEYYTGASWEYVYADGSPGIGLFTSLSHPWGGAPTYAYTEYLLGVR
ncbi:Six-hairpin glycosidase, partial [Thozetella sp. PMI_491]